MILTDAQLAILRCYLDQVLIGDDEYDGLIGRTSQINGLCTLSQGKAFDVAMFRMNMALMAGEADEDEGEEDEDKAHPVRSRLRLTLIC